MVTNGSTNLWEAMQHHLAHPSVSMGPLSGAIFCGAVFACFSPCLTQGDKDPQLSCRWHQNSEYRNQFPILLRHGSIHTCQHVVHLLCMLFTLFWDPWENKGPQRA